MIDESLFESAVDGPNPDLIDEFAEYADGEHDRTGKPIWAGGETRRDFLRRLHAWQRLTAAPAADTVDAADTEDEDEDETMPDWDAS